MTMFGRNVSFPTKYCHFGIIFYVDEVLFRAQFQAKNNNFQTSIILSDQVFPIFFEYLLAGNDDDTIC